MRYLFFLLFPCLVQAESSYEKLFPLYVDTCAVSQEKKKDQNPGRPYGHLFIFLQGACRDRAAKFPQLKRCQDEGKGTAVSVNSLTKNVNWLAIEGRDATFNGFLAENERLTKDHFEKTLQKVIDDGVYNGVTVQPATEPTSFSDTQRLVSNAVTYDFATSFGRDAYCVRTPVNDAVLTDLLQYLNQMNKHYFYGDKSFQWSAIYNNCAHLVHNMWAAIGVWEPLKIEQSLPVQVLNLAVPANELLRVHELGNTHNWNIESLYTNKKLRDVFLKYHWLPMQAGTLFKFIPFHKDNDLYLGDLELWKLEIPFLKNKTAKFKDMISNPLYKDIKLNLRSGIYYYNALMDQEFPQAYVDDREFISFYREIRSYLTVQVRTLSAFLNELN